MLGIRPKKRLISDYVNLGSVFDNKAGCVCNLPSVGISTSKLLSYYFSLLQIVESGALRNYENSRNAPISGILEG